VAPAVSCGVPGWGSLIGRRPRGRGVRAGPSRLRAPLPGLKVASTKVVCDPRRPGEGVGVDV